MSDKDLALAAIASMDAALVTLAANIQQVETFITSSTSAAFQSAGGGDAGKRAIYSAQASGFTDEVLLGDIVRRLKALGLDRLFERGSIARAEPLPDSTTNAWATRWTTRLSQRP